MSYKREDGQMRILGRSFLWLVVMTLCPPHAIAQTLELQVRGLALIREAADGICLQVRQTGSTQSLEVRGQVSAAINRLVATGIAGTAQFKSESYEGVLQSDLANVLRENMYCRRAVLELLVNKLLVDIGQAPKPLPIKPASTTPSGPILRVFIKNNMTESDVNALARLLPSYDVRIGASAVDRRFSADILFVNRDAVSPSEVMVIADTLRRLGVQIKSVQQSPLGGRREIQIGTILDPDGDRQKFQADRPLDLGQLRNLSGNAFWIAAFNGKASCQAGIGFGTDCHISASGRPVH